MDSNFKAQPVSSPDNKPGQLGGVEQNSLSSTEIGIFPCVDCFGGFNSISDEHVVGGVAAHGWGREQIDWLDQQIEHYNRELGITLSRRFVAVEPQMPSDVGVADQVIYIPLTRSNSPHVLRTYIDWILLHEPMHQRQRRLLGISESTVNAFLSAEGAEASKVLRGAQDSGDVTKLQLGLRDWEARFSIPPLRSLKSILPDAILALGIRLALDLHADARIFRDGHKFMPSLSNEEVVHGVTLEIKLLAECIVQCACEMFKLARLRESGRPPHLVHVPYLARFCACINAAAMVSVKLDASQQKALGWYLAREGSRLACDTYTAEAGSWVGLAAHEGPAQRLATDYDGTVRSVLKTDDLRRLYCGVATCYTDLLLLIINRQEFLPPLSVLNEALSDVSDPLMRERAVEYMSEVGGLEALVLLANRLRVEEDLSVQKTLVLSMGKFGSTYARQVLKVLNAFRKKRSAPLAPEVAICIAQTADYTLLHAMLSSTLSQWKWHSLEWQGQWLLMPLLVEATHTTPVNVEVARAVVHALSALGGPSMDLLYADTWAPKELINDAIHALARSFCNTYSRIERRNEYQVPRSRWQWPDYDVGSADEELMLTFHTIEREFDRFIRSNDQDVRGSLVDAYELMIHDLSQCNLGIKHRCLEQLTDIATHETDPASIRKAIALMSALFHAWHISDPIQAAPVTVRTPTEVIETPYKVHRASTQELKLIFAAYDKVLATSQTNLGTTIAEEMGRRFGGLKNSGADGGMYASAAWSYLERFRDSSDSIVRCGCAEAAVRMSLVVPEGSEDVIGAVIAYLRDGDPEVRYRTVSTLEQALFEDRRYVPVFPDSGTRRVYKEVVVAALKESAIFPDVRDGLSIIRKRWETEIGMEGRSVVLLVPDCAAPAEIRDQQLNQLEKHLRYSRINMPIKEKGEIVDALVRYLLAESLQRLREKALPLIFEAFVIHSLGADEADGDDGSEDIRMDVDGTVWIRRYDHPDSLAETEVVLKGCKGLMDRGDDSIRRMTLDALGDCFGHSDFHESQGCPMMAFEFMKGYSEHSSSAVRLGLAEGAVKIYNTLVAIMGGPHEVILKLLRDSNDVVRMGTVAAVIRAIQENGKDSSFSRCMAEDVLAPALNSDVYSPAVRDALKAIDAEAICRDSHNRQFHNHLSEDTFIPESLKALLESRRVKKPGSIPEDILHALRAPEETVRIEGLRAVRSARIVSAAEEVVKLCRSTSSNAVRREGVKALGCLASDDGINYLIECLVDRDYRVAGNAARGLGKLKAVRAIPELIAAGMKSQYRSVVVATLEALGRIYCRKNAALFPANFEKTLTELVRHSTGRLQKKCDEVLNRVQKESRIREPRKNIDKCDGHRDENRRAPATPVESTDDMVARIAPSPADPNGQPDLDDDDFPSFDNDEVFASDSDDVPWLPADSSGRPDFGDDDVPVFENYAVSTNVDDDSISALYDHDLATVDDFRVPDDGNTLLSSTPRRTLQIATEDRFIVVEFSDLFADTGCVRILRDIVKFGLSEGYTLLCDCRHVGNLTDRITHGLLEICKAGIPVLCLESNNERLEKTWEDINERLWSSEYATQLPLFVRDRQLHDVPLLSVHRDEAVLNYVSVDSDLFDEHQWKSMFEIPLEKALQKFSDAKCDDEDLVADNFVEAHYDVEGLARGWYEDYEKDREEKGLDLDLDLEFYRHLVHDKYGPSVIASLRALRHTLQNIAWNSSLVEYVIQLRSNSVILAPYHSQAIHSVEVKDKILLGRPAIIAAKTASLLTPRIHEFETLLEEDEVGEREIETWLERNPAVFEALGNRQIYSQAVLGRDGATSVRPDFIVQPTSDEWCEILDIKLPTMQTVVGSRDRKIFSSAVCELVAQLRRYSASFESETLVRRVERSYGIKCYRPRLIGAIGADPRLVDDGQMRGLMTAYSDVKVLTFDQLQRHANTRLLI